MWNNKYIIWLLLSNHILLTIWYREWLSFCPEQFHSSRQRQSWQDAELPLNSIPTSGNGGERPYSKMSLQWENLKSRTDQLFVRWTMNQTNLQINEGECYEIDLNLIPIQSTFRLFFSNSKSSIKLYILKRLFCVINFPN